MKTSELTGRALDWAVAKCEGREPQLFAGIVRATASRDFPDSAPMFGPAMEFSTDWSQGGPLLEQEKITLDFDGQGLSLWTARKYAFDGTLLVAEFGDTPLIAVCRCYVAIKLGDDVDIPEE